MKEKKCNVYGLLKFVLSKNNNSHTGNKTHII